MDSTPSPLLLARMETGITRGELAKLSGVPQSTIYRIEIGEVSPSIATMDRVLAAVGRRTKREPDDIVDMSAVAACRGLLDPDSGLIDRDGTDKWVEAWTRAGFVADPIPSPFRLCLLAAANARLQARKGQRAITRMSATELTGRLRGEGIGYALTGSAAANRIKLSGTENWTVCYVDNPKDAARVFEPPARGLLNTVLLPLDEITGTGVWQDDDGTTVADPIQVLIDCLAGTGRMPSQAELLAELFDEESGLHDGS